MGGLVDKIRELIEKIIPVAIVGLLALGGWQLYKAGTFRYGLKPAITQIVGKVPYFGTRFRHYLNGSGKSYVAGRSVKKHHGKRRGKAHHRKIRRRH